MRVRSAGAAAVVVALALAAAGCGAGSASPSSSSSSSAGAGSTPAATGTTGTGTGTGTGTDTTGGSTGTGTAGAATQTSTSTSRGGGKHGKSGSSTPAAPAGLAGTTGYGTYEFCAGTCTGSVPASLRRPLKLPDDDGGPCPATFTENGPVQPLELPAQVGFGSVPGSPWLKSQITWTAAGTYTGPILIRGGQIGGDAGPLGFGQGATPYDELQLLDPGVGAPKVLHGGRAWISLTRVRTAGCYAYQIDGTSFSEVIVFRAVG
jgi:hypothetical protein